ncbi:hypothetical protein [Ornithinibacillus halotolerans]|nr:hypothetical protein [Ornithinibacillus halotolerans]
MESYENNLGKLELYQKLAEGEAQIKNGKELIDGQTVLEDIKKMCEDK